MICTTKVRQNVWRGNFYEKTENKRRKYSPGFKYILYGVSESGSYAVVAANHAGESEAFALMISRDALKAAITER